MRSFRGGLFACVCILLSCNRGLRDNIKTGAEVGSDACEWVTETTDAGAVLAICATLQEIAKYGRVPGRIIRGRGQVPPRGFTE